MWIVAKIKNKEISFFINQIEKKIGSNVKFYCPKIELERWFGNKVVKYEKSLLEDYIFCYHDSFKNEKSLSSLNFIKGLKFFLKGCELNQKEIVNFIEYCKSFENGNGKIRAAFFKSFLSSKAKFISGPFNNIFFEIIEKQKNKLKVLLGNIVTIIPDEKNYIYQSV